MTEILEGGDLPAPEAIGDAGAVVTVGVFDGVHRGHRAVIDEVRARAAALGAKSVVVTFEPHPLAVLRPEVAPQRLTTAAEKQALLAREGLDFVLVLPFTPELAQLTAREFVRDILLERLRLRHLVIGYDHRLGRGRTGDLNELRALGAEFGFGTDVVPAMAEHGQPISSSFVRTALREGDVVAAAAALGRPYSFQGKVVRGDGRGRTLGFPTANLEIEDEAKLLPLEGIYAARATIGEDGVYDGVIHIGPRPTFPGAGGTVELHLFDFDRDIYGETVTVACCARIREIREFGGVEELIEAMEADCAAARAALAAEGGACQ